MIRSSLARRAFLCAALAGLIAAPAAADPAAAARDQTAHDFSLPGIDGAPIDLSAYKGKPILVVNTASRCGYTGQYEGLQQLWDKYRDQGLVVIGAPSGDFRQELATADKVKDFCEITFGITFPMTDILHVRGPEAHPFFAWAAERSRAPSWNFNKYLIGKDGSLLRYYDAMERPEEIGLDVEAALALEN